MPVNISLKPGPTLPCPICLAPCSTCLVARSTFVLSAAAAAPQDRAMTARQAGGTHNQRDLQVMTHLLQWGWLTPSPYHPVHLLGRSWARQPFITSCSTAQKRTRSRFTSFRQLSPTFGLA